MDTVERKAQTRAPPSTYDGFISYSHAADDLLAPRLQAGLQRFAKPWWKRRAVRIFRDESSLAANPHLWSSITEALDSSGWFVLLLSPDAASSEWVNKEIQHWVANKQADRILPVLTDGEFGWIDGDVAGSSVPPALRGVFDAEPRWVDLRFAKGDENLDLKNPAFSSAVADIASAIRGIPKDELASEEVRQHRRTVRTAWAAGIAVTPLAMAAVVAGLFAIGQRNDARDALDLAEAEAERANQGATQLLDFARQLLVSTGIDAITADSVGLSEPLVRKVPSSPRLHFLNDECRDWEPDDGVFSPLCVRAAVFVNDEETLAAGNWVADMPFHIRHGFVNPSAEPLAVDVDPPYSLQVYVTRLAGPDLEDGAFPIGQEFLFRNDYLVRTLTDRCGPGYRLQDGELPCDQFVHEFPDGLPPGRYDIWAEWHAPCSAWIVAEICGRGAEVVNLFSSFTNTPFYDATFTNKDDPQGDGNPDWPFDVWEEAHTFFPRG